MIRKGLGKILCKLGRHKWRPEPGAKSTVEWYGKYDAREFTNGVCDRCNRHEMINREFYW